MAIISTGKVGVGGPGTNIDPLQQLQQQGLEVDGTPSQGVPLVSEPNPAPVYSGMSEEQITQLRGMPGFENEVSAFDNYQKELETFNRSQIQPLRNAPGQTPNESYPLGSQPQTNVGQDFLAENIRTQEGGI